MGAAFWETVISRPPRFPFNLEILQVLEIKHQPPWCFLQNKLFLLVQFFMQHLIIKELFNFPGYFLDYYMLCSAGAARFLLSRISQSIFQSLGVRGVSPFPPSSSFQPLSSAVMFHKGKDHTAGIVGMQWMFAGLIWRGTGINKSIFFSLTMVLVKVGVMENC